MHADKVYKVHGGCFISRAFFRIKYLFVKAVYIEAVCFANSGAG